MKGKIALVTGGSRGIGRAIAVKMAQEGCDVAILYAGRKEAADETVSLLTAAGARGRGAAGPVVPCSPRLLLSHARHSPAGPGQKPSLARALGSDCQSFAVRTWRSR